MSSEALAATGLEQPVLHLVPGISASGKTTAGRYMVNQLNDSGITVARLVVPHTTRAPRAHEINGIDYHFHTPEDYSEHYRERCDNPDDNEWSASKINGNYYFNSMGETSPTDVAPISILPVAYNALPDVIAEHANRGYAVSVLPIIIGEDIRDQWLATVQPQRPTRDLERELDEQAAFLSGYNGEVYYSAWDQQHDTELYYRRSRVIMAASRMIINATMETDSWPKQ